MSEPVDLELMELHLRCLYSHDEKGRIARTREPGGRLAARFHLGRTRLGNLWRCRRDLSDDEVRSLARLAAREAPLAAAPVEGAPAPPERLEPFRRVLGERATVSLEWAGPAYRFPAGISDVADALEARASDSARVLPVTPRNAEVLERHFAGEIRELAMRQPCFAAVEEGRAVAVCQAARPLSSPGEGFGACAATEAGVETLATHRGRGLAPRVAAAWAVAVLALGGRPLYSTSWDNTGSRSVARKLGLVCYGEDVHLT